MIRILDQAELEHGAAGGRARYWWALENGCSDTYGGYHPRDPRALPRHIISAQAEFACALALDLPWSWNVGNLDSIDVGDMVEVRSIQKAHHKLILHPKDKDHLPCVQVLTMPPRFELTGWVWIGESKRKEFWRDPTGEGRPAFFVPKLRPMLELVAWIEKELATT
jgi:hypothetical protein